MLFSESNSATIKQTVQSNSFTFRMHLNMIKKRREGTFAQNNKLTNPLPSNKCNLYTSLISTSTQLLFFHISSPIFLYKPKAPLPNSFETTLPTYLTQCRISREKLKSYSPSYQSPHLYSYYFSQPHKPKTSQNSQPIYTSTNICT